jgi:hypothetical protein
MKSIISRSTAGRSLGLLLSLFIAGTAYAGPSAQQLDQLQRQRDQNDAYAPAAAPAASTAKMACSKCTTQPVRQFSSTNSSGRLAVHSTVVGAKHSCDNCGGAMTTINGRTSKQMMDDCPVCAKANPTCCTAKS